MLSVISFVPLVSPEKNRGTRSGGFVDLLGKQSWIRIPFFIDGVDQMNKIFIDKLTEIKIKLSAS